MRVFAAVCSAAQKLLISILQTATSWLLNNILQPPASCLLLNKVPDWIPTTCPSPCRYVSFFNRHAPVQQVDPQQDQLVWSVPPVFVLDLTEDMGGCRAVSRAGRCEDLLSW
jgi:hypothetical protein